jgi:hypothetical protein
VIVAAAVGIIDVLRRLSKRSRRARGSALAVLGVLAVYCVVANIAISLWPVSVWTLGQAQRFVSAENALSLTPLAPNVKHGARLPDWAPGGQLFIANNCSGLYLGTGNSLKDDPGQLIEHLTWLPVEQGPDITHTIGYSFNEPPSHLTSPITILTYGSAKLIMEPSGKEYQFYLDVENSGTSLSWPPAKSGGIPVSYLHTHSKLTVITDPNLNQIVVWWNGKKVLGHYLGGTGPAVVRTTPSPPPGHTPIVTVTKLTTPAPDMSLCQSLLRGS